MTGEPVRPGEPKLSDMAKIDFSTFRPIPPPPGRPLKSTIWVWPHAGKSNKFVCRHGARARWSLKTSSTLTKLSESFNCIMEQSPTEYKGRGEGAPTPSRAPKPSRFVTNERTDGRTNGRTERDTLKSPYAITLILFGATEVAIINRKKFSFVFGFSGTPCSNELQRYDCSEVYRGSPAPWRVSLGIRILEGVTNLSHLRIFRVLQT